MDNIGSASNYQKKRLAKFHVDREAGIKMAIKELASIADTPSDDDAADDEVKVLTTESD